MSRRRDSKLEYNSPSLSYGSFYGDTTVWIPSDLKYTVKIAINNVNQNLDC